MSNDAPTPFPTQEEVTLDLQSVFRGAIRLALESLLEEELRELVGAGRYERTTARRDQRNGSYLRRMLTTYGYLDVTVPRAREATGGEVLGRYKRRTNEIDDAITAVYVNGVSTRGVGRVTEALLGEKVSRSTVSRVTKQLEEQVESLRKAPIDEKISYLYLDATFLDARWARSVENVAALVAYGIDPDGKRRLLAVTIGAQESEASWTDLLQQLLSRGLDGVCLVISDDHAGLKAAVRRLLPEVPHQRCTVHLTRNVTDRTPKRLRPRVIKAVLAVLHAASLVEAKRELRTFQEGLGAQVPEAAACLASGFAAATQHYAFPAEHWKRIRSTNGIERLNTEIKRRIKSIGAFPDRASALRLVTAVCLQTTEIWSDRRYVDVSLLNDAANDQAA